MLSSSSTPSRLTAAFPAVADWVSADDTASEPFLSFEPHDAEMLRSIAEAAMHAIIFLILSTLLCNNIYILLQKSLFVKTYGTIRKTGIEEQTLKIAEKWRF